MLSLFYNLRRFIKYDNILRTMNINNHLNETNVAISLAVSITNNVKIVRIYLRNPVSSVWFAFGKFVLQLSPYRLPQIIHPWGIPLTPRRSVGIGVPGGTGMAPQWCKSSTYLSLGPQVLIEVVFQTCISYP